MHRLGDLEKLCLLARCCRVLRSCSGGAACAHLHPRAAAKLRAAPGHPLAAQALPLRKTATKKTEVKGPWEHEEHARFPVRTVCSRYPQRWDLPLFAKVLCLPCVQRDDANVQKIHALCKTDPEDYLQ